MQSLFPQMLHFKINLMYYIESNCRISRFTKINALLVPSNAAVQELAYIFTKINADLFLQMLHFKTFTKINAVMFPQTLHFKTIHNCNFM